MKRFLAAMIILFVSACIMKGQGKMSFSIGLGFPETLNAGLKARLNQSQLGLNIGFWPANNEGFIFTWENVFSICGDYYYHFAGKSVYSDLKPFYFRAGLNYLFIKWSGSDIDNLFNTQLRVGRDFYFPKNGGLGLDGGLILHLNDVDETWGSAIGWSAGVCLFFVF